MYKFTLNETSYHGAGAIKAVPEEIKNRGFKKAFVASDPDLVKFGVSKKVTDLLEAAGIEYTLYSDIKPNPTIENVKHGVEEFKASGAECIVAIGGGSSMDTSKAIGIVIPELNGKLIGSAQRVPTCTGSTTILVAVVKGKDITKDSINAAMKAASNESFGYNTDEIVSSDVIGMRYGSLFDATQTMVAKLDDDTYQVQVVAWYDNENSYTSQMVRTIKYFANVK